MKDVETGDLFGTEPRLLHRREARRTSKIAAYEVNTSKLERQMFNAICAYSDGCIADDLIETFSDLSYSSITARPSALERKRLIVRGPDTRTGSAGKQQLVMRKAPGADALIAAEDARRAGKP